MKHYYIEFDLCNSMTVSGGQDKPVHGIQVVGLIVIDEHNRLLLYNNDAICTPSELKENIERVMKITGLGWPVFQESYEYYSGLLLLEEKPDMIFRISKN